MKVRGKEVLRPAIVCLCGSTRFGSMFHEANLKETLAGKIVLSIGCDFKSDADLLLAGSLTVADKQRLDILHLHKIDLADEILVLNVGGYIGASTAREILYALKPVRFLEPLSIALPESYIRTGSEVCVCDHSGCGGRVRWFYDDGHGGLFYCNEHVLAVLITRKGVAA